jgi:hypothetical protein
MPQPNFGGQIIQDMWDLWQQLDLLHLYREGQLARKLATRLSSPAGSMINITES